MVIAITPGETWDYIIEDERELESDEQTVFVLRTLTNAQHKHVSRPFAFQTQKVGRKQRQAQDTEVGFDTGEYLDRAIKAGLDDVRNFRGRDGVEIPFAASAPRNGKRAQVTEEFLDRIPNGIRTEIAGAILDGEKLEVDEVKN